MPEKRLDTLSRLVLAGACLTVLFTAFELKEPLFSLGPVSFTTSKLAAAFFIAASLVFAATRISWYVSRRVLDVAVAIFAISNFLSVLAAQDKPSAFKFSIRLFSAVLVYLAVSRLPARSRAHLWVAGSAAVTLILVTVVGLLENFASFIQWTDVLEPLHEGVITFGTFYNVRVSSTLPFPTTLSIFLEMALPLALAFGIWYENRVMTRRRWVTPLLVVLLAAVMLVQVLTFTRMALVVTPVSLLTGAWLAHIYGYGRRFWGYLLLGVAMLILTMGLMILFSNKFATRLDVAEQERHYGVEYTLLSLSPDIRLGQTGTARIHIKNTGTINWAPAGDDEVLFGYRWMTYPDNQVFDLEVDPFAPTIPESVPPGGESDVQVDFLVPKKAGKYVLVFDLAKLHVSWFSSAGPAPLIVPLEFVDGTARPMTIPETADSYKAGDPALETAARSSLWRAGFETWKANPVLGVGPDQFRVRYTDYSPDLPGDQRLRTHNIFLEAMADTGLIGLAAVVFLLLRMLLAQFLLVRDRSLKTGMRYVSLALLIGTLAYIGHGMVDYFLWQTGISFLFFIYAGLTSWLEREARDRVPEAPRA